MTEPFDTDPAPEEEPAPQPPPRWAWCNLNEAESVDLDEKLEAWIADYNRELTGDNPEHIIPACWRQHSALVHSLPKQFYAWEYIHRIPAAAKPLDAADYDNRILPAFQDRLPKLIGNNASKCRVGKHSPRDRIVDEMVHRAATDTDAHGPNNLHVLRNTMFGTT